MCGGRAISGPVSPRALPMRRGWGGCRWWPFSRRDLYSAPLYFWHGMVSWDTIIASVLTLPMVFLGNWLGSRHFLSTDPQDFRKFAIGLLALLATLGLLKSVF